MVAPIWIVQAVSDLRRLICTSSFNTRELQFCFMPFVPVILHICVHVRLQENMKNNNNGFYFGGESPSSNHSRAVFFFFFNPEQIADVLHTNLSGVNPSLGNQHLFPTN